MEMDLLETKTFVKEWKIVNKDLWKKQVKVIFAQTFKLKMSAIMMVVAGATGIMKHANQLLKKMKLSMEKMLQKTQMHNQENSVLHTMVKWITAQAKKVKDVYTKETNATGLMLMLEMMKLSMEKVMVQLEQQ